MAKARVASARTAGAVRTTKANLASTLVASAPERSVSLPDWDFTFLESLALAFDVEGDELDPVLPPRRTGRWVYRLEPELSHALAESVSSEHASATRATEAMVEHLHEQ